MDEKTMLTIIEALARALENEKLLRVFYENRVREYEEKEQKNG